MKGKDMKRAMTMLSAFAVVWALALPSWAQVKELPTDTKTIEGTIETIDNNKRAMNIKTADGKFVAVNAPESVKRFDELKVGDKVKATYNNNVIVRLKPPGEPAVDTADPTYARGETSGTAGTVRRMTATIVAIDKSASSITFAGPNEWKYSRRIVDPTVFDQVKVGDRVDIIWNTDLTVSRE
ncbi:MAG: hypothetical protein ACLQVJ_21745 [Syntrophobacteraceae bacterium]